MVRVSSRTSGTHALLPCLLIGPVATSVALLNVHDFPSQTEAAQLGLALAEDG